MSVKKLRIGVLFGGRSTEHEVSLVSAASVVRALDKKKYEVVPVGITKTGQWVAGPNVQKLLANNAAIPAQLRALLPPEPQSRGLVPLNSPQKLSKRIDVIFPVLHGTFGEDGTVQGLLELANIPYVGAGVLGSSVGMDKIAQKMIFQANNLPTPAFYHFSGSDWRLRAHRIVLECKKRLGLPAFVKPANLGSSVGIRKVHTAKELKSAIVYALKFDRRVIVEKSIEKAMEIECAVLGNDQPKASLAGQILPSNEFYDYDAKYVDGKSKIIIPAPIPKTIMSKIRAFAQSSFTALDLAGMARVDFLVQPKGWRIYINEVNTIPGFTSISMYPKLWQASGMPYTKLLDALITLALKRFSEKSKLHTSYKPKAKWYR